MVVRWAGYMDYGMWVGVGRHGTAVWCGGLGCVGGKTREKWWKLCLVWCGRGAGLTLLGLMADPVCTWSRGARLWERALGVGGARARLWVVVSGSARGVIFTFHQPRSPIFFLFGLQKKEKRAGWSDFFFLFVWKNSRWCPVQAGFRGMVGRQPSPHTLPRPGHVHAAALGGAGGPGHRLVVAHGGLSRGGWVKRGG